METSEYMELFSQHAGGLDDAQQAAWGVLFTLLVTGGAAPDKAAAKAAEMAESASPEELAELAG